MFRGIYRWCMRRRLWLLCGGTLALLCFLLLKETFIITPLSSFFVVQELSRNNPDFGRQQAAVEGFLPASWNFLQSEEYNPRPDDWTSSRYCDVRCRTRVPCEYLDEVDLRIIVFGATRADSLSKALKSLYELETLGDRLAVDIWLDRLKDGTIDKGSYEVARYFSSHWVIGRVCVHTQTEHAFVANQWVYSYRPRDNTSEIVLFMEDDLDLSPYAYKWLKAAHAHYRGTPDVAGITLRSERLRLLSEKNRTGILRGPKHHPSFMYPVIACWGYSPMPWVWREFQTFFHEVRKIGTVKPYVDGYLHTVWYKRFEEYSANGGESLAHEMWHIYFTTLKKLFVVYNNLLQYSGQDNVQLTTNRMENGLHFSKKFKDNHNKLLRVWNDSYVDFPSSRDTVRMDVDGNPVTNVNVRKED